MGCKTSPPASPEQPQPATLTPTQIFAAHNLAQTVDVMGDVEQRVLARHAYIELDGKPPEELILSSIRPQTAEAMASGDDMYSPNFEHHVVSFTNASRPEGEVIWTASKFMENLKEMPDALVTILPPDAQGRQAFFFRGDTTPMGYNPGLGKLDNMLWDVSGSDTRSMLTSWQGRPELIRAEPKGEWYYNKPTQLTLMVPDDSGYWRAQPDRVWETTHIEAITLHELDQSQVLHADILGAMRTHARSNSMPASGKVAQAFKARYMRTQDVSARMDMLLTTPLLGADVMGELCEPLLTSSDATMRERDACMSALLDVAEDPQASTLIQAHLSDLLVQRHTDTSEPLMDRSKFLVTQASLKLSPEVFRASWERALRALAASKQDLTYQEITPSWDTSDDDRDTFGQSSIDPLTYYDTLWRTTLTMLRESLERQDPDERAYTDILTNYVWNMLGGQVPSPAARDALRELIPRSLALSIATSRFSQRWHIVQPLYMATAYPQEFGAWSKDYIKSAPPERGELLMLLMLQKSYITPDHDMVLTYLRQRHEAHADFVDTLRMNVGVNILAQHEPSSQAFNDFLINAKILSGNVEDSGVLSNILVAAAQADNTTLITLLRGSQPAGMSRAISSGLSSPKHHVAVLNMLLKLDMMPSSEELKELIRTEYFPESARVHIMMETLKKEPTQAAKIIADMSSEEHLGFVWDVYNHGRDIPRASILRLKVESLAPSLSYDFDPCQNMLETQTLLHMVGEVTLDQILQATKSSTCKTWRDDLGLPPDGALAQYAILASMGRGAPVSNTWRAQIEELAQHPSSVMRHLAQKKLAHLASR